MMHRVVLFLFSMTLVAAPVFKAEKTVDHGVEVIRLTDASRQVQVSVVPSIGNRAYELSVGGKNLLYFPTDIAAFKQSGGRGFNGIPFLAPWGNRIPGGGFWANGRRYNFNSDLGNLSMNSGIAIHGMLTASDHWEVIELQADSQSAHVTSRFQFWKYPDLMANWPFAHEYLMTYRLTKQGLQVETVINNMSAEPMPVAIGYHPYFNIPGVPRSEWSIHIAARKHVETDKYLVATGDLSANNLPDQVSLADHTFDDGFTDLVRDHLGEATFSVQAGSKRIEVVYGRNYNVALVYAPPKQEFMCFEPMAAITNGINLAHEGKYSELQTIAAGGTWRESFWVRFSGFQE